jgi:hypothetical protein
MTEQGEHPLQDEDASFRLTWSAVIDHRRFTTIDGNFCSDDDASDVKKKQASELSGDLK